MHGEHLAYPGGFCISSKLDPGTRCDLGKVCLEISGFGGHKQWVHLAREISAFSRKAIDGLHLLLECEEKKDEAVGIVDLMLLAVHTQGIGHVLLVFGVDPKKTANERAWRLRWVTREIHKSIVHKPNVLLATYVRGHSHLYRSPQDSYHDRTSNLRTLPLRRSRWRKII